MASFVTGTKKPRPAGFTLVELVVGLAVVAMIITFAVPSYRNVALNSSIRGSTMDMVTAINLARAQAVNLRQDVKLRASDNASWDSGWVVDYLDAADLPPDKIPEIDQTFAPDGQVSVVESGGVLTTTFGQDGLVSAPLDFTICDSERSGETGRQIQVNRIGRLSTSQVVCP